MIIRKAAAEDAPELSVMNTEFNGYGGPDPEMIRESICSNAQEIVFVSEKDGKLTGFLCMQLKRSFCYTDLTAEITEMYVRPEYRRNGTASEIMLYAERFCREEYQVRKFELLTGDDNQPARSLYESQGYECDGEIHMSKRSVQ